MSKTNALLDKLVNLIAHLDEDWYPNNNSQEVLHNIEKWFTTYSSNELFRVFNGLSKVKEMILCHTINEKNIALARQIAFYYTNTKYYRVYKHTAPNSKVYIGITCQEENDYRWVGGEGYRNNQLFYSDIVNYGWDSFVHETLYENLDAISACRIEQKLISQYKANIEQYGYNIDKGGGITPAIAKLWQYDYIMQYRARHRHIKLVVPYKELKSCYIQVEKWGDVVLSQQELDCDFFDKPFLLKIGKAQIATQD